MKCFLGQSLGAVQRGFRMLAGLFALLLGLPAVVALSFLFAGLARLAPADLALAGILLTGASVAISALAAHDRTAILACSAFSASVGLVALAFAPAAGRAWPQSVALGLFLFAGSAALALSAPAKPAQRSSTGAADS